MAVPELWAGGVKWWWERCRIWGGGLAEVREGGREWGGGRTHLVVEEFDGGFGGEEGLTLW